MQTIAAKPTKSDKILRSDAKNRIAPRPTVAKKQAAFLYAVARTGNISQAAATAKISRQTHYDWLENDPTYQARFNESKDIYLDRLVAECDRRAVEGASTPIINRNGDVIGHRVDYSDTLLMFRLKKLDHSYRERYSIETKVHHDIDREGIRALMRTPEGLELSRTFANLILQSQV